MFHAADIALFELANGLAGRSFTVDAMMALALDSPVVKGGPIAACFLFAWWHASPSRPRERTRSVLLLTLLSLAIIAPAMKVVSTAMPMTPRPLVAAENVQMLNGREIVAGERVAYRAPATGPAAALSRASREGSVESNDLASFPSDHAAFFAAFAGGIFLAMRSAGLVAIGWAVLGIFLPRVVTGLHWPSDIGVGALAGLGALALIVATGRTVLRAPLERIVAFADSHPGWAQAAILVALFEAASAMATLKRLVALAFGAFGP